MLLTRNEKESLLWKKLEGHLTDLLESDRRALEKMTNSNEMTAHIRGRIKRTRELIALASAPIGTESLDN
jgi:hypothetical protein